MALVPVRLAHPVDDRLRRRPELRDNSAGLRLARTSATIFSEIHPRTGVESLPYEHLLLERIMCPLKRVNSNLRFSPGDKIKI